jgi:hypothetical protein
MLRTATLLPLTGLSTLGFDAGRFPPTPPVCYRASWQLPGPDSHRQATTSLRPKINYTITTSGLLGARKIEVSRGFLPMCEPERYPQQQEDVRPS